MVADSVATRLSLSLRIFTLSRKMSCFTEHVHVPETVQQQSMARRPALQISRAGAIRHFGPARPAAPLNLVDRHTVQITTHTFLSLPRRCSTLHLHSFVLWSLLLSCARPLSSQLYSALVDRSPLLGQVARAASASYNNHQQRQIERAWFFVESSVRLCQTSNTIVQVL